MRRQPERLPRSLAPLPGEDLPGFILRLAHRLDLTPVNVLRQTGLILAHRAMAPARLMLMLEGDELARFCSATGMSAQDASGLTFRPHVNSYPPVTEALLGMRGLSARTRGVFPVWLLTTSTRYCPSCLAGDGSVIQQRHGGPWKTEWRMAANFACLEHRVFLLTTCPSCGLPPQMIRASSGRLIAEPFIGALHPAQCRNVVTPGQGPCGARLDSTDLHDGNRPSEDLLDLQRRLLRAHPYGASRPFDPMAGHNRMTDLLIVAAFIRATWPLTAPQAPSDSLAQALEHDVKRPGPAPSLRLSTISQTRWDSDPFSAQGTAALLAIAARTLNLPMAEFRSELRRLIGQLPAPDEPAWGHTWLTLKRDGSPLFKHEVLKARDQKFPRPLPTQAPLPTFLSVRRQSYRSRFPSGFPTAG